MATVMLASVSRIFFLRPRLKLEDDLSVWVDLVLSSAYQQASIRCRQSEISSRKLIDAGFSLAALSDQLEAIYMKSS